MKNEKKKQRPPATSTPPKKRKPRLVDCLLPPGHPDAGAK